MTDAPKQINLKNGFEGLINSHKKAAKQALNNGDPAAHAFQTKLVAEYKSVLRSLGDAEKTEMAVTEFKNISDKGHALAIDVSDHLKAKNITHDSPEAVQYIDELISGKITHGPDGLKAEFGKVGEGLGEAGKKLNGIKSAAVEAGKFCMQGGAKSWVSMGGGLAVGGFGTKMVIKGLTKGGKMNVETGEIERVPAGKRVAQTLGGALLLGAGAFAASHGLKGVTSAESAVGKLAHQIPTGWVR